MPTCVMPAISLTSDSERPGINHPLVQYISNSKTMVTGRMQSPCDEVYALLKL
jgi:hypothetical protein